MVQDGVYAVYVGDMPAGYVGIVDGKSTIAFAADRIPPLWHESTTIRQPRNVSPEVRDEILSLCRDEDWLNALAEGVQPEVREMVWPRYRAHLEDGSVLTKFAGFYGPDREYVVAQDFPGAVRIAEEWVRRHRAYDFGSPYVVAIREYNRDEEVLRFAHRVVIIPTPHESLEVRAIEDMEWDQYEFFQHGAGAKCRRGHGWIDHDSVGEYCPDCKMRRAYRPIEGGGGKWDYWFKDESEAL